MGMSHKNLMTWGIHPNFGALRNSWRGSEWCRKVPGIYVEKVAQGIEIHPPPPGIGR
jgi:hypothetical protein